MPPFVSAAMDSLFLSGRYVRGSGELLTPIFLIRVIDLPPAASASRIRLASSADILNLAVAEPCRAAFVARSSTGVLGLVKIKSHLPGHKNTRAIFLPGLLDRDNNLVKRRHPTIANKFLGQNLPGRLSESANLLLRVKLFEFCHVFS